jgi:quinol monooxygenase YgiN
MADDAVLFRAVWTIKPGRVQDARKVAREFVDAVKASQPGTRWVGTHITPDERNLIVHEVHQDAAAVMAHVTGPNVAQFRGFEVYGNLPPDLTSMISAFGPKTSPTVATFVR